MPVAVKAANWSVKNSMDKKTEKETTLHLIREPACAPPANIFTGTIVMI